MRQTHIQQTLHCCIYYFNRGLISISTPESFSLHATY